MSSNVVAFGSLHLLVFGASRSSVFVASFSLFRVQLSGVRVEGKTLLQRYLQLLTCLIAFDHSGISCAMFLSVL